MGYKAEACFKTISTNGEREDTVFCFYSYSERPNHTFCGCLSFDLDIQHPHAKWPILSSTSPSDQYQVSAAVELAVPIAAPAAPMSTD